MRYILKPTVTAIITAELIVSSQGRPVIVIIIPQMPELAVTKWAIDNRRRALAPGTKLSPKTDIIVRGNNKNTKKMGR